MSQLQRVSLVIDWTADNRARVVAVSEPAQPQRRLVIGPDELPLMPLANAVKKWPGAGE